MTEMTDRRSEATTPPPAARPPGRPRSERAEKAIIEATLDLLTEEAGVAGVSIEAVAARACVGKTTIYRRWPNKEALIVDALAVLKGPMPQPRGDSVREDLVAFAEGFRIARTRRQFDCYWTLIGSSAKYPELWRRYQHDVLEPRREIVRAVLRRGIETGELRPDVDVEVALSLIVGSLTLHVRSLGPGETLDPDLPSKIVDSALRGLAP